MKKQFFSIVMVLALVIVAGTAMAQTSLTPYAGGTYSYSISGIDNVARARTARVFIDNDGISQLPNLSVATKYVVASSLTVTPSTNYYDLALPSGTTAFDFSVAYNPAMATGAYQLYVVVYDGADTQCSNFMFRDITVTANNFDLAVATTFTTTCQTINASPATNTLASTGSSTIFTYIITKTGGDNNDDWSFDFDIPSTTSALDIDNITALSAAITTGLGTNSVAITGTITSGNYNVKVINGDTGVNASVVTITVTVPTTTGANDAPFAATASAATVYVNQSAVVSIATETSSANNAATATMKNLPNIGSFTAN